LSLDNFLIVSAILFAIGLYGALSKRNAIAVLMSIELMFNAVNLAAVAFSRYTVPASLYGRPSSGGDQMAHLLLTGQVFSIFIITIAAAEVALGLAIVIAIYRSRSTVFVTDATQMRK
jgi:NADH:ubiquinone oxidoreductase subunit K